MIDSGGNSPFQHSGNTVRQLMQLVLYALLPGLCASVWFFGVGILINISIAVVLAMAAEAIVLRIRNRNYRAQLADCSVIVTAVLFAIFMPPGCPWWLSGCGIVFAVVVAKHLYGGLGQNPFNPAMCGYLMLLLTFPQEMTGWSIPGAVLGVDSLGVADTNPGQQLMNPLSWSGLKQSLLTGFPFLISNEQAIPAFMDGLAMASPLSEFKMAGHSALLAAWESDSPIFARESGTAREIITICYLSGGLFLLYRRIISWHIPITIIATILTLSGLFYAPGSIAVYGTPYLHLLGSTTMIAAFFIATDPVSAATTSSGKIYYGIIIGLSIYSIRVWGSYPDAIAPAVLLGNFCAPLLDHFCRPPGVGHSRTDHSRIGHSRTGHSRTGKFPQVDSLRERSES